MKTKNTKEDQNADNGYPLLSDVDAMINRYNKDLLLLETQLDKLKIKMCLSMTDKWNNKVKEIEICNARLQTLYILKGGMKK